MKPTLTIILMAVSSAQIFGCGLDWSLPTNHFDGVEEHGYVSYWEKMGEADLGDGLVIPVNINFNSHREASSPYLGKGWLVALLESHVEPVDENCMSVIMPDGRTFTFLRNGNTETWRGNAGWVGETKDTIFTITAPCGWRIKFDQGKIQEIDSNTNRTFTYRYNGGVATEVDEGNSAFVKVESNSTGVPTDLVIGGQKIDISLAQRPQVMTKLSQNLIIGFDQSLNQLQWLNGKKESFTFGADKSLNPTLAITSNDRPNRNFSWSPETHLIKGDGDWTYQSAGMTDHPGHIFIQRINSRQMTELWDLDLSKGTETTSSVDGTTKIETRFVNGLLAGKTRKIEEIKANGERVLIYTANYNENGQLIRSTDNLNNVYEWKNRGNDLELTKNGVPIVLRSFDEQKRMVKQVFEQTNIIQSFAYSDNGSQVVTQYTDGSQFIQKMNLNGIVISQELKPLSSIVDIIKPKGEKNEN
jgi:hypothetical protein